MRVAYHLKVWEGFFVPMGTGKVALPVSMGTEKVALLSGRCAIYETIQDNK